MTSFGGTVRRKLICLCLCGTCFTTTKWITKTLQNHRKAQTASQERVNCDRSCRGRPDTSRIILISRFYSGVGFFSLFFYDSFNFLYFILWPSPMHWATAVPSPSLTFQSFWILLHHPHTHACLVGVWRSWKKEGKRKKKTEAIRNAHSFVHFYCHLLYTCYISRTMITAKMHLSVHDADKLFLHAEVSTLMDTNTVRHFH